MKVDKFNQLAEKDFRAKAFANYCDKRAENFQKIFPALTAMVDAVPDEESETREIIDPSDVADEIIQEYELNGDEYLALDSGFIKIKDLLIARYNTVESDISGDTTNDSYASCIALLNSHGEQWNNISMTEVLDELKASYHATVSTAAALFASYGDSVSEKLTLFRDKVSEKFENAFSDYSSIATSLVSGLKKGFSPVEMFNQVRSMLQIEKVAEEEVDDVSQTDFSQYSGASPVCALCFDNVFSAIGSTVVATAKVVAGIVSGIGHAINKVFNWIGSKVHQIVTDPYDLDEIDSKINSYTIDGFQWQVEDEGTVISALSMGYNTITEEQFNTIKSELQSKIGYWIKYKTVFSEHLFKLKSVSGNFDPDYPTMSGISIHYTEVYRLKPITREAVNYFLLNKTSLSQYDNYTVRATVDTSDPEISGFEGVSNLYYNTGDSEVDLYKGFVYSAFLLRFLTVDTIDSFINGGNTLDLTDPISNFINESQWPATVTNKDFIYAACGYDFNQSGMSTEYLPWNSSTLFNQIYNSNIHDYGQINYFTAFCENIMEEILNPLSFPFLPYLSNVEGFEEARFTIKTDEQNQQAFKTFMTIVIIVAVVAIVTIKAIRLAKRISRRIRINRIAAQGRMDSAMWNGEKLTARQARKYFRLVRKNSGAESVTSGLLSNAFKMLTTDTNGSENFYEIIDLIK